MSIYFFLNAPWHSQKVDDYFSYESQRLPAFCSEYNLRIKFNSGKIVNLHLDCCGQCDYTLYKLKDDKIYMEAKEIYQPSYIVDTNEELVYRISEDSEKFYQLNGEPISGYSGSNAQSITFHTYKGDLNNYTGTFTAKAQAINDMLNNNELLGELSVYSFEKQ